MGRGPNSGDALLNEALLEQDFQHQLVLEEEQPTSHVAKSSSLDSIWNLTNVILGAGKDKTSLNIQSFIFLLSE